MQFYVTRFNWVNEPIRVFIFRRFEDEKNGAKSWERRSESFWLRFSGFHRKFRHRDDFFFFWVSRASPLAHQKKNSKKKGKFSASTSTPTSSAFRVPDCSRLFQAVPGCSRSSLLSEGTLLQLVRQSGVDVIDDDGDDDDVLLSGLKKNKAQKKSTPFSLSTSSVLARKKKKQKKRLFFSQAVFSALGVDFLEMLIYSDKSRLRHPRNAKRTKKKNIIFFLYNFFFLLWWNVTKRKLG